MGNWYTKILRRRIRAQDRSYIAQGRYDRIGAKHYDIHYEIWEYHYFQKKRNARDVSKNRHHNSTAQKLLYRRLAKLKLMWF